MIANSRLIPYSEWALPTLTVADGGQPIEFTIQDAFNYHGYDAVGGVVLGFRLLQRAIASLTGKGALLERRELSLLTAFPGMGARDCFELVSRMVSEGRFTLDVDYVHPAAHRGIAGSFYFRFDYRGESVELSPVEGQPPESFLAMGRASKQADAGEENLRGWTDAKYGLANFLLTIDAQDAVRIL